MNKKDWAAYFEKVYETPDPWAIDGKYTDKVRAEILNNFFRGRIFRDGIDVCCGEGVFTSKMMFVKNKTGVDISNKAIGRANEQFPEIDFKVDDFLNFSQVKGPYSFVSCFEALYYPESDDSRKLALLNIRNLGDLDSCFAFSVVTNSENTERRYFTKENFINLLEKYFLIEHITPFVLRSRSTILSRFWFSFLISINESFGLKCARNYTARAIDKDVYQHLFILRRKM